MLKKICTLIGFTCLSAQLYAVQPVVIQGALDIETDHMVSQLKNVKKKTNITML